jgi:hypothetical protein
LVKKTTIEKNQFFLLLLVSTKLRQAVRKYSNEFMNIGVDAAALGMANAVTASTADVNSGYGTCRTNQIRRPPIALMHANYFKYSPIRLHWYSPIDDRSAWGFLIIRFGVDDILNTTELIDSQGNIDYNRISLFSTADYGFTFSYARKLAVWIWVNAKIIRRIIGNCRFLGFGFDVGLQFERKDGKFGLMVRDITTTYNVWNIDEKRIIADAVPGQNQELLKLKLQLQKLN